MGHSQESDDELRVQARERIGKGSLPRAKAARTWGGLGSGLVCDLCDSAILATEPEFELQFELGAAAIRFHRRCHAAWEFVRKQPAGAHELWTPVTQTPPPASFPVEVRLDLGDSRTVILGAMLSRDAETSDLIWINLTTQSALPRHWKPVEWRVAPGRPLAAPPVSDHSIQPPIPRRA